MNTVIVKNCKTLFIGRRGENKVTEVLFDFSEWQEQFGAGVIDLYVKRNLDIDAYPVVLSVDGTVATWLVSAADTDVVGNGKIEYVYTVNEKIAKSAIFQFFVGDDIGESSPEPPEHYQSWLEQLTELGAETQANAQAAAQSASEAAESASEAAQSESNAAGSATTATTKAQEAEAAAAQALIRMNSAATSAQTAEDASSFFTSTILPNAVTTINNTRDQAVANVNVAKSTAVQHVSAEGATQISALQTESTTQQAAIQQKGEDVLDSIPADYTELSDAVNGSIVDIDHGTLTPGYVDTNVGNIRTSSSGLGVTDFIDVHDYEKIAYLRLRSTSTTATTGMCFYDSNQAWVTGIVSLKGQAAAGYDTQLTVIEVPAGAYYARFTAYRDTTTYGNFIIKGIKASIPGEIENVNITPQFGNIFTVDYAVPVIDTTNNVLSLYDKLVEDYPKLLSKNTLTSGSFTNYEYIFSTGNYNTKGARSRDSVIAKPKVLIMSGIHGDERSAVVGLYHFVKAMCEHVYSLNAITDFCEFRIVPVVNPYGYDNNSRLNSNGVNINRNFDSPNWELTSTGDDYSGAAPGDQLETQVIQDWLIANQDAAVFVDCHNSGNQNELACLLGLSDAAHLAAKRQFLYSINKIIPYLKKRRNIQDFNTFSYTGNTSTTGASKAYGEYKGIMSYTYEMSINIDQHGRNGAFTNATGSELIGAMLKGLVKYVLS